MKKESQTYFFKKVVKIPIFYGNFVIIFSNDVRAIQKVTKANVDFTKFAFTFHDFPRNGTESITIVFNFWLGEPVTLGTLMHEINHAGNRLMLSIGADPDYNNDESETYVKAWMADEVEDFMIKCKLLTKPNAKL